MKQVMEYLGPVKDGVLPRNVREAIAMLMRGMEGKIVKVAVSEHKARRSGSQNAYHWSVIVPHWKALFKDAGELLDNEEVHNYLVRHVGKLDRTVVGPDGAVHQVTPSTSDLDTKEFTEFLETCRRVALSYGCDIPPPDPEYYKSKGLTND